jgi:hypothetical protein
MLTKSVVKECTVLLRLGINFYFSSQKGFGIDEKNSKC